MKTNICKFADGNTLYSCTQYLNDVIEDLPYYPKTVLKWFKDNRMMTNLRILQFMILSKTTAKLLAIEIIKKKKDTFIKKREIANVKH